MRDAPVGLLPNLVCRGVIVHLPVGWVAVLIRVEILLGLAGNDLVDTSNRAVRSFVPGGSDKLGSKSPEDALALVRGAVRQAKLHGIAKCRRDRSVGNAGIAAGCVDERLAGAKCAAS